MSAESSSTDRRGLGDTELQSRTLESHRGARFYHRWLTELALPYLGSRPLELGSGLGDYAQQWIDDGVPAVTVTDLDDARNAGLHDRFAQSTQVDVADVDVFRPAPADYTSLVAYNVLEHIDDHVAALRSAHVLLEPGGRVIMFVPAFPFAMGELDRKVGHFRRYTKKSLRAAYEQAGLTVERIHYVNAPGLFAWFLTVRLLRMTPADSAAVRLWDSTITRAMRSLEYRIKPPFGNSVFAVGRVPG